MEQEAKIAIDRLEDNSAQIRLLLLQIETNLKIIKEMLSECNPEK